MSGRSIEPVALVMCPAWGVNMPPLGIAYLASYLQARGVSVSPIDLNIEVYHHVNPQLQEYWREEYLDLWIERDFFRSLIGQHVVSEVGWSVDRILAVGPRVVGFSVNQANLWFSCEVAKQLKAQDPSLTIIFGGPGVYWVDRQRQFPIGLLDEQGTPLVPPDIIDVFVHGDGEETLWQVLRALEHGTSLAAVGSISARIEGQVRTTGPHRPNPAIDQFPFPTFDWVDFDLYRELEHGLTTPARIAPIIISRGCINNCKFCNDFVMQGKYRWRSPENAFEEMFQRMQVEGLRRFFFCDLLVNGNLEQLRQLATLLARSGFPDRHGMRWTGQALARPEMDVKYLTTLRRSGCHSIIYGVESFSDTVLLAMRKNITSASILSVLKASKAAGLSVHVNLIVGYPGEREQEFEETLAFLQRHRRYIDRVAALSMLTMTHGSPLFVTIRRANGSPTDSQWHRRWVSSEDPTNTYEVRAQRFERLHAVLTDLGLVTLFPQQYERAVEGARIELSHSGP